MIESEMPKHSRSLARRVNSLEMQILSHHRNVRTVESGFKRKITARMVSPASLLTAFGIGIVMEKSNRHRGWSMATVVAAANASIRLLLSFASPQQSVTKNSTKASTHDFTQQ
jgi:hypothetical protein